MKTAALCLAAACLLSTTANAALESRLGGLAIYDTDLNITWLADANYAGTTMDWATANRWVASISIGGVSGWRLPTTLQPDNSCPPSAYSPQGTNCTGSEMGHLFYNELGGVASGTFSLIDVHNDNFNLFQNFQVQTGGYWSGTELVPNPEQNAWYFNLNGGQYYIAEWHVLSALAVHDGDVVPVPAAAWLFGSGLIGLAGLARKRKSP